MRQFYGHSNLTINPTPPIDRNPYESVDRMIMTAQRVATGQETPIVIIENDQVNIE